MVYICYLVRTSWTFIHHNENNEINEVDRDIVTPESTPPQDLVPDLDRVGQTPASACSSSPAMSHIFTDNELNMAYLDLLEWDMTGTVLHSHPYEQTYPIDLNRVVKLDGLLPLVSEQGRQRPISTFQQVVNLDHHLPISSTPSHTRPSASPSKTLNFNLY